MKFRAYEILNGKYTTRNTAKSIFLVPFTLLLIMIPLTLMRNSHESAPEISSVSVRRLNNTEIKQCNIFSGRWIHSPEEPYYNNETCHWIIDQQNCMKFGRPDREYLHWRWKPDECDLPLFSATQFLNLVRGKKMAFVGDSVGRNQMQSLLCLLSHVSEPEDVSHKYSSDVIYFKRYFYHDYNFTLGNLWSPYFVRSSDADPKGHSFNSIMKLYLDEADEAWTSQVENFDIVIISTGQWFFRPLLFYEEGQLVGCNKCEMENVEELSYYYGYKKAFRTAFRTLNSLEGYKGVTFLRTFSPAHFEGGDWNKGGKCVRTRPFTRDEMRLDGYILEMYMTQVKEFREAQREATKRGLKFLMMNTTEIMLMRPDGHPNNYGHTKDKNVTLNDCVHWCLPGPVDTWNEFLLYMLDVEREAYYTPKPERIF
ncbi:protein trichome birefringence-like 19 [Cajanus cajan]|nr:protein trichome birefringence-like 19 [Cajanus cajan]